MKTRSVIGAVLAVFLGVHTNEAAGRPKEESPAPVRTFGTTIVVGESDPALWKTVLDVLPARPRRIELLDLNSVSGRTRQTLRGLDAFVLTGSGTVVVIRQGATLRQAELGDAIDRLVLASLVWHELAHANGLDERAALAQERWLWRRFITRGLVDGAFGLAYIARLADEGRTARAAARFEAIVSGSSPRASGSSSRAAQVYGETWATSW